MKMKTFVFLWFMLSQLSVVEKCQKICRKSNQAFYILSIMGTSSNMCFLAYNSRLHFSKISHISNGVWEKDFICDCSLHHSNLCGKKTRKRKYREAQFRRKRN